MTDLDAALAAVGRLDAQALRRPWTWRDGQMEVRFAFYRTLEDVQEALVRAAAGPPPESRRILALAQRAFGDLRGLLAGLPDALLDTAPQDGEWTLREVLRHVAVVERRYAMQTAYAIDRAESDPLRISTEQLAAADGAVSQGSAGALLAQIGAARADTDRRLGDLPPAAMLRPTGWLHYQVDVRFRLHRFAAHRVEHTVQSEKTLDALGWRATEGRWIARRVSAAIAELEGLGAVADAREMEGRLAERLASVTEALARG